MLITLQLASLPADAALRAHLVSNASAVRARFAAYGAYRPPESLQVALAVGGTPPALTLLFTIANATSGLAPSAINGTDLMRFLLAPAPAAAAAFAAGGGAVSSIANGAPPAPLPQASDARVWAMELTIPALLVVGIVLLLLLRARQAHLQAARAGNDKLVKSRPAIALEYAQRLQRQLLQRLRGSGARAEEVAAAEAAAAKAAADGAHDSEEAAVALLAAAAPPSASGGAASVGVLHAGEEGEEDHAVFMPAFVSENPLAMKRRGGGGGGHPPGRRVPGPAALPRHGGRGRGQAGRDEGPDFLL